MRLKMLVVAIAVGLCQAAVNTMDQNTLKGYLEKGADFDFLLIDLRTSEEIREAIGNNACKPYHLAWPTQFKAECEKIPKDQVIIVYCKLGGRAQSAAAYLGENGWTSVYNAGGISTWTGPTIPLSEMKPVSLLPEPSMRVVAGQDHLFVPAGVLSRIEMPNRDSATFSGYKFTHR